MPIVIVVLLSYQTGCYQTDQFQIACPDSVLWFGTKKQQQSFNYDCFKIGRVFCFLYYRVFPGYRLKA